MSPTPAYADVLAALQARGRFGIRLGLGRTRALLRVMGSPERTLRGVLIGGTNGKGSAQAMVAAALRAQGLRVGQTPKPHLVSYRERVVVDGQPIAPDAFAALVDEVLAAADRVAPRLGPPTEFEVLTVAALAWFARTHVDVAVVEVGLGGRLDATNAWDGGVAAITNVGWDHMDRLGPTLEAIAREKAAIIKRGDRAVTGADPPGLDVIRRRARRMGVPLRIADPLPVLAHDRGGLRLHDPELGVFTVGLLGRHQAANAAVALAILRELAEAGIAALNASAIRRGLAAVRWPGRLELLGAAELAAGPGAGVEVLLDGAHNADGAAALAAALDELRPSLAPGPPTLLLGVMADKDVPALLAPLATAGALAGVRVVATAVPGPRALPAEALAQAWRTAEERAATRGGPWTAARAASVTAVEPVEAALGQALRWSREASGPLVVAGSLYLVGAVRGRLVAGLEPRDAEA